MRASFLSLLVVLVSIACTKFDSAGDNTPTPVPSGSSSSTPIPTTTVPNPPKPVGPVDAASDAPIDSCPSGAFCEFFTDADLAKVLARWTANEGGPFQFLFENGNPYLRGTNLTRFNRTIPNLGYNSTLKAHFRVRARTFQYGEPFSIDFTPVGGGNRADRALHITHTKVDVHSSGFWDINVVDGEWHTFDLVIGPNAELKIDSVPDPVPLAVRFQEGSNFEVNFGSAPYSGDVDADFDDLILVVTP